MVQPAVDRHLAYRGEGQRRRDLRRRIFAINLSLVRGVNNNINERDRGLRMGGPVEVGLVQGIISIRGEIMTFRILTGMRNIDSTMTTNKGGKGPQHRRQWDWGEVASTTILAINPGFGFRRQSLEAVC